GRDHYYIYRHEGQSNEYFYFYYTFNNTQFGVPGGQGIYVTHTDLFSTNAALPQQQRLNNHFIYEMVQADGLNHLQDAVNSGDAGDPFPGTSGKFVFSADTIPSTRWWDQSDAGIRIIGMDLPTVPNEPAVVIFERYSITNAWPSPVAGAAADTDGDGMADAWEIHFWGDLATANATSDFDGDGLTDAQEYILQSVPTDAFSLDPNNLVNDAFVDSDMDGIINLEDLGNYGTDPNNPDTDDDGLSDLDELSQDLDPRNSLSPYIMRHVSNDGAGFIRVPGSILGKDRLGARYNLTNWTLEATVRLTAVPTNDIILVQRRAQPNGYVTFELGIDAPSLIPYVR
ncbi:MAG: hypothetical protein AAF492_33025, partial [Verrucomicrobiota bacterium]